MKTAARYWHKHITSHPMFNPDVECVVVLMLNVRRRITGHSLITVGLLDTCLVAPREVFRMAVLNSASAIILMHNHPSGDPTPSANDIKATRESANAGAVLGIQLFDHVIVGGKAKYASLKELGYL